MKVLEASLMGRRRGGRWCCVDWYSLSSEQHGFGDFVFVEQLGKPDPGSLGELLFDLETIGGAGGGGTRFLRDLDADELAGGIAGPDSFSLGDINDFDAKLGLREI